MSKFRRQVWRARDLDKSDRWRKMTVFYSNASRLDKAGCDLRSHQKKEQIVTQVELNMQPSYVCTTVVTCLHAFYLKFLPKMYLPKIRQTIKGHSEYVSTERQVQNSDSKGGKSLSDERAPILQNAVVQLQSQSTMASSSITRLSQLTDNPRASVHRIMRRHLHLYPYHFTLLQNITEEDKEQRATFANWLLDNEEIVPNILWSDEANSSVDGIINKHNCVIWSPEAPHE
ncbi:hypothetical protein CLF_113025 [Clonorchis sinensis]|uniref:Uncharacterized protein n=1 Tax=Clonorchis sinensis TaxID=79923 RepID=G7YXH3_CLOSI|nr:hypothetical protein CLF_113025 [Clonorchis sinensis]